MHVTTQARDSVEEEMGRRKLMPPREAARFLGVHPNTLRRWSDLGLLQSYRIGVAGHRRYRLRDLEAYLDSVSH